ncbi:hypothetical protein Pla52o_41500 [Novipirellula galeiformis]|uniref:PEP-CTERM protein-sorting domain-containing protein n=1 Tax=Novipirellula galeiformis TaxID=2528004 RepID=A0A5C6CCH4_9BACT|nr:hypothetical protein [Novipirellula galeiformis]TWU21116.1 hypothetical protein Pla52o_41500 [Novipirellula galeiformis]
MNINVKTFLASSVLAFFVAATSHAASVFPTVIDSGPYDSVENGLRFSVSGFYSDQTDVVPPFGPNGVDISQSDELLLFYKLSSNDGGAGENQLGLVLSADVDFGDASLVRSAVGGTNGSIAELFAGQLAGFTQQASAAVALVSGNFAAVGPLSNYGAFQSAFATAKVEALLDFGTSSISGTFNLNSVDLFAGLNVLESSSDWTPTSFIPVNLPQLGPGPGSYDFGLTAANFTSPATGLSFAGGIVGQDNIAAGGSSSSLGAVNPIPEPASMLTLLGCVTGACAMGRRRRKALKAA